MGKVDAGEGVATLKRIIPYRGERSVEEEVTAVIGEVTVFEVCIAKSGSIIWGHLSGGGVTNHPVGGEGVVLIALEGVIDGADVVAGERLAQEAGLAVGGIGGAGGIGGEDGDGDVGKEGASRDDDVEALAVGDLGGAGKVEHHAVGALGKFAEDGSSLAVQFQGSRAPEHLVVDAFHLDAFDVGVALDGDFEECAEVAELEIVAALGAVGGHGVVDFLVGDAVDGGRLVVLDVGQGDGAATGGEVGDLAGGVEGQEVLVSGDLPLDGGGVVVLVAMRNADSALDVVDFHLVASLPAGVVVGVDVGFGVGVVLVLLDGGGKHAPLLLFLA